MILIFWSFVCKRWGYPTERKVEAVAGQGHEREHGHAGVEHGPAPAGRLVKGQLQPWKREFPEKSEMTWRAERVT